MNSAVSKALDRLESGRWNAAKALASIEAGQGRSVRKRATWLRIRVVENGEKKFSVRLPFGLMSVMSAALTPFVSWGIRHAKKKYPGVGQLNLEKLDLKRILKILRDCGPLTVVEVSEGKTEVLVETS